MKNNRISKDGKSTAQNQSINQKSQKTMKKNRTRMGGLSLQVFANAKTKTDHYNPAWINKQREFYKNVKYVSKYKKSSKQPNQDRGDSSAMQSIEVSINLVYKPFSMALDDGSENAKTNQGKRTNKKTIGYSLKEVYNKQQEEEEKARMERKARIQIKKEETERAQSRRKAPREKMFKKTRSGQPVMKYRIEHLLQIYQGSKD